MWGVVKLALQRLNCLIDLLIRVPIFLKLKTESFVTESILLTETRLEKML